MGEETRRTERHRRLTRRGVLAVAGATALAGCGSIADLGGDSEPTIRAYDLPDVDTESIPEPVLAPSIPVDVDPAYLAASRDRVTGLLARLPTPFGPADIPNGHVRKHLTDAADTATDGLDDARTARTDLLALRAFRSARGHARYAAAGWAVADEGLSASSLRAEHDRIVADARSARADHEYVGTDPVGATLVHARIESWLARVIDTGQPLTHNERELLTVAEWGEAAEQARAYLEDARQLDERFTASLPDDSGTVEEALTRAAESLLTDARSRRSQLPPEPTAEDWGLADHIVHELWQEADRAPNRIGATHGPASAIVDLTGRLAAFRAFHRVRERVDAGEISSARSARELRQTRTRAYDALEGALEESPAPDLARAVLSDVSWRVSHADRGLGRYRGDLSPARLDDVMEEYILATAVARATPPACRRTVDALEP